MSGTKQRSASINNAQKEALLEFVEQHPNLRSGRFTKDFTFKKARELWEEISEVLNSMPTGAVKDWLHWRKTWQDMKKNTKAKASQFKKQAMETGGGAPSNIVLNTIDDRIIDIISPAVTDGLENVAETQVQFEFEEQYKMSRDNTGTTPLEDAEEIVDTEVQDHLYHMSPTIASTCTPGTSRMSKTKRLETSLKLTNQLVKGLGKKVDITEDYYESKKKYYEHRIGYEEQKLQLLQLQCDIGRKVLAELINFKK